jgi:hypothetical protein
MVCSLEASDAVFLFLAVVVRGLAMIKMRRRRKTKTNVMRRKRVRRKHIREKGEAQGGHVPKKLKYIYRYGKNEF